LLGAGAALAGEEVVAGQEGVAAEAVAVGEGMVADIRRLLSR